MHPNEQLIHQFYTAFQNKDFRTMQSLYRDEARFSDPVFHELSAKEARAMWEMLISSASDLKISYSNVTADERVGKCRWEAWYTFSKTGRPVHNIIDAQFAFREGKILSHLDKFDFWRWSRMALGTSGLLLGWTGIILHKIRRAAWTRLNDFMAMKHR